MVIIMATMQEVEQYFFSPMEALLGDINRNAEKAIEAKRYLYGEIKSYSSDRLKACAAHFCLNADRFPKPKQILDWLRQYSTTDVVLHSGTKALPEKVIDNQYIDSVMYSEIGQQALREGWGDMLHNDLRKGTKIDGAYVREATQYAIALEGRMIRLMNGSEPWLNGIAGDVHEALRLLSIPYGQNEELAEKYLRNGFAPKSPYQGKLLPKQDTYNQPHTGE